MFGPVAGLRLAAFIDVEKPVEEIATKKISACNENDEVTVAIGKMLEGAERVSVISDSGEFRGFITQKDIIGCLSGSRRKASLSLLAKAGTIAKPTPAFGKEHKVGRALEVFKKVGAEVHPILAENRLAGIITERDLIKHINRPTGVKVRQLMVARPITAKETYKVNELARMMYFGFSRMPVQSKGVLTGMVTPYDILSFLHKNQRLAKLRQEETETRLVMNREPAHALAGWDVHKAVETMRANNVSGLPVIEDDFGRILAGIITERDIVDALK